MLRVPSDAKLLEINLRDSRRKLSRTTFHQADVRQALTATLQRIRDDAKLDANGDEIKVDVKKLDEAMEEGNGKAVEVPKADGGPITMKDLETYGITKLARATPWRGPCFWSGQKARTLRMKNDQWEFMQEWWGMNKGGFRHPSAQMFPLSALQTRATPTRPPGRTAC